MTDEDVRQRFAFLGVWQRGGVRAPYKPLMLLYALARYRSGAERLIPFVEMDEVLLPVFRAFGPIRRSYHISLPFWYLRTDGVWEVEDADRLASRKGKSNEPPKRVLVEADARAGLTQDLYERLMADPELLEAVASDLLSAHFPETLHEEILSAVGLEFAVTRAVRNSLFRQQVLVAYGFRCAVCGFDARIGDSVVGIEAAHIKWHQAGGPGTVTNGMAMCSLHHVLFDRGAFTLTADQRLEVSALVNGGPATMDQLIRYDQRPLSMPRDAQWLPRPEYVSWHRRQVFKGAGLGISPAPSV
jgi:putative restriction endonuclease